MSQILRGSTGSTARSTTDIADVWTQSARRRPWLGLGLLGISIAFTLAVVIYFGAWSASEKVQARQAAEVDPGAAGKDVSAWEEGFLWACPLH
ncbi:MAG: hypothetical protein WD333_04830 [Dehalococcoidia bacterium]